jgi:hypothetical protein
VREEEADHLAGEVIDVIRGLMQELAA